MKLMICTPSLTGQTAVQFTRSMIDTARILMMAGIEMQWRVLSHCNFVHEARNSQVNEFLTTDFTDLLFIDDDMGWQADELLRMICKDADVVGAICPRRKEQREWNVNLLSDPAGNRIEHDGMLECAYVGTALMRIRRNVCERMPRCFDVAYEGGRLIGEDAWFCREFRRLGGRVWAERMTISHVGPHEWRGRYDEH